MLMASLTNTRIYNCDLHSHRPALLFAGARKQEDSTHIYKLTITDQ